MFPKHINSQRPSGGKRYVSCWGRVLSPITYDGMGNPLTYDGWTFTWEHGRELSAMSKNGTTWTYSYDANGMRTKRTNGSTTYSYVYNGSQLTQLTVNAAQMRFIYGGSSPVAMEYAGETYFYVFNLQGDVVTILDSSSTAVVNYSYDAWGNVLAISGTLADTVGVLNPFRYRGYVYDHETGLYYLQSRYYNPEWGRFLNADAYVTTGQGLLGNNMFVYCGNNPVIRVDASGEFFFTVLGAVIGAISGAVDSLIMGGTAEDIAKGALAGGVSGAISGAGVDIGVAVTAATGGTGVGAGLAIAGVMGAIGSAVGTGISTDWEADPLDYAASALVGGLANMLSFGLAPINGEIGKGALTIMKGIVEEGFKDLTMNVATGTIIATGAIWITRVTTNNNQRTQELVNAG